MGGAILHERRRGAARGPAPWLFLVATLAWSWVLAGLGLALRPRIGTGAVEGLVLLGTSGPLLVPLLLISVGRWDRALDRSAAAFLRRAFDPRTLPGRWYAAILALVLVLAFGPPLLDPTVRGARPLLAPGPPSLLLLGFVAGFVEEPGWRGYAQEGLQRRMPVLAASLVIGAFWALWHLPLFYVPGTYQWDLGVGTPAFWSFHAALVAVAPLYAWLYNAVGRSAFAPVLLHALANVAYELVPSAAPVLDVAVPASLSLVVTLASWRWMSRRA